MDSDAPTTGKPNATRFVQNAEVPGWIENVKQHWLRWAIVLLVAIFAIYHFSAGSSTDSSTTAAVDTCARAGRGGSRRRKAI